MFGLELRIHIQDEYIIVTLSHVDDTDVDKNPKEQTLPANTDQNDKYGNEYYSS